MHPHSVNAKGLEAMLRAQQGSERDHPPVIVAFDEVTRGDALLYVRECSVVAAPALVLVAASLTVEALPEPGEDEEVGPGGGEDFFSSIRELTLIAINSHQNPLSSLDESHHTRRISDGRAGMA